MPLYAQPLVENRNKSLGFTEDFQCLNSVHDRESNVFYSSTSSTTHSKRGGKDVRMGKKHLPHALVSYVSCVMCGHTSVFSVTGLSFFRRVPILLQVIIQAVCVRTQHMHVETPSLTRQPAQSILPTGVPS